MNGFRRTKPKKEWLAKLGLPIFAPTAPDDLVQCSSHHDHGLPFLALRASRPPPTTRSNVRAVVTRDRVPG
ncbi:hypothetical protein NL676_034084 [Syzygium grande]|nr:hypothetical protein NL676_034084 [Syzygium grande]